MYEKTRFVYFNFQPLHVHVVGAPYAELFVCVVHLDRFLTLVKDLVNSSGIWSFGFKVTITTPGHFLISYILVDAA